MIGILNEKPSQARNFAKALGGMQGIYNGEQYMIVPARGHLYEFQPPEVQVPAYKTWSLANLPWNEEAFNWKRMTKKDTKDAIQNIKNVLSTCDEIIIATDNDPTGEGQLLAIEILQELRLSPKKFSRMYFIDESPKEIQKAFVNRVVIPDLNTDPDYVKAFYRIRWDFLSMQFTRIATLSVGKNAVLRQGRLKSAMVLIVGDQLKAVSEYKKIPFYTNKFKDENGVIYTNPEEPQFKNKDDVPDIYKPSSVTVDSKSNKSSPPPKLIDLATLSSLLAPKGFTSAEVLATVQKLYEANICSYPRTEDKFISPEQFNDLLPKIDQIAAVVSVDTSLLTHRTPRSTHVKTGGAHGANRPGPNVPSSLESLLSYGKAAPAIYEILAKNYLAMLCEDYEYEAQVGHVTDYPKFVGRANVPISLGYKKIFNDMDDPDEDESAGLGTHAEPFVFEGFPPKPQSPTMKWLMKQLEKHDVGTGATRTSIYSEVTNPGNNQLLIDKKGKISMAPCGEMSYMVLPGTHIGDLTMTEKLMHQMKEIAAGKLNPDECLREIQELVKDDIVTMQANAKAASTEINSVANTAGLETRKEKAVGIFNGKQVEFNREWSGHRFTDDELQRLLNGEEIEIYGAVGKSGKTFDVKGKLDYYDYQGKKYFGFTKTDFLNNNASSADRCTGTWNGEQVSFKKEWCGHVFTDAECEALLRGEEIEIYGAVGKSGKTFDVKGKLSHQTYNGKSFVGFEKTDFLNNNQNSADRYSGTWNGKQVSFKRSWGGHTFTDAECEALLRGEEIEILGLVSKSGSTYGVKGRLAELDYQGKKYIGFNKTDFAGDNNNGSGSSADERYTGTFNGKQISFKRSWGGHIFTDEECEALCNGEEITITGLVSKSGSTYGVRGKLKKQSYNGHPYYGFDKTDFV